jgi:predicted ATPase
MIQRLYAHNFRCLENFELDLSDTASALLIGKNGSGKSSISAVLEVFQSIGRGINRIRELVKISDFAAGCTEAPMRFELQVLLDGEHYKYTLALELPNNFKEPRVLEERLEVSGEAVYSRNEAQVVLHAKNGEAQFLVDWHLVALPVIQQQPGQNGMDRFKQWLSHIVILAPLPPLMNGESSCESLQPLRTGENLGEWMAGVLGLYPSAYRKIDEHLRAVLHDLQDFVNESTGKNAKNLVVRFEGKEKTLRVPFSELSDGEKCFFLGAVMIAANDAYGPLFCFWDEPDNYLSLSEVAHFITQLRRSFQQGSQVLVSSHNPEAIRRFSSDNTFVLGRKSHLEPTRCRLLRDIPVSGDLVDQLILGDVEP